MSCIFTLKVEVLPKFIDFSTLKKHGSPFESAGKISKHRSGGGYDIWLCRANTSAELSKYAQTTVSEILNFGDSEKLEGFFCMGLFPDPSKRVDIINLPAELMTSLAKIGLGITICYYP